MPATESLLGYDLWKTASPYEDDREDYELPQADDDDDDDDDEDDDGEDDDEEDEEDDEEEDDLFKPRLIRD